MSQGRDGRLSGGDRDGETAVSEPMRRVVEAVIDGQYGSPADREALTEAERAELGALMRTANLTRMVLHEGEPDPAVQSAALERAQISLKTRRAAGTLDPVRAALPRKPETRKTPLQNWIDRLLGRGDDSL